MKTAILVLSAVLCLEAGGASAGPKAAPATPTISVHITNPANNSVITAGTVWVQAASSVSTNNTLQLAIDGMTVAQVANTGNLVYGWTVNDFVGIGPHYIRVQLTQGKTVVSETVTVNRNPTLYTLSTQKVGPGVGTGTLLSVTNDSAQTPTGDINCGATCSAALGDGAALKMMAVADPGSVFMGWGGACSGTGSCYVVMNASKSLTASFNLVNQAHYTLDVLRSGAGAGTVTSTDSKINCGATCAAQYDTMAAATVSLTATPAQGSAFAGWSGACSGTGACVVPMTQSTWVAAAFTQ